MDDLKVAFNTMEKFDNRVLNSVGSSRIRARWLINMWQNAEEYQIGKKYDVMIYQKVYWDKMMDEFEGVQILDLCDPDWLENKPVFEYIDKVDATVTSTEALAEYIRELRPDAVVQCIPDRIFLPEHYPHKDIYEGEIQTLVWYGFHNNFHYLTRTLDQIMEKGIELTVVSDQPYEKPIGYEKLKVHNTGYSYPAIHNELIKHDAVLLPDPYGDAKGKFKSNNKMLTAWALGVPVVKLPSDIDRLKDPKVREKEAKEKLIEIGAKWDVRYSVLEYQKLISELWKK